MRRLDARLGRIESPPETTDQMLERAAGLGDQHEQRFLEQLRSRVDVVEIPLPDRATEPSTVVELTTAAFESNAADVYQAAFLDGIFLGYVDFIVRNREGRDEVFDTKLARHTKITAQLQLAAYSEQLQRLGIPTGDGLGDSRRRQQQRTSARRYPAGLPTASRPTRGPGRRTSGRFRCHRVG